MNEQQLLAIMTVEINPQAADQIYIHDNDDPRDLTILFASKHDLPGRLLLKLVDSITAHKQQAMENYQNQLMQSPQKGKNYYKGTNTPIKSIQSSQIFSKLNSNVYCMIKNREAEMHHLMLLPVHFRKDQFPRIGSRLFYMREEIKAKRDERLQKVRDECKNEDLTFTPKINQVSEEIMKRKNEHSGKIRIEERLMNYGKNKEQNLQQLRMKKIMVELDTENRMPFQPKLRQSMYQEKSNNSKTYREISNKKASCDGFAVQLPGKECSIAQQVWMVCLKRIFKMLDITQSGKLSSQSVDLSKLDYQMLQIIAPILVEMEEKDQTMKFQDFAESVTNYCLKHNFVENLLASMMNKDL